jgi:dsDNA-binding SOS-regulon protein
MDFKLMAEDLERLLNEYLDSLHQSPAEELRLFLWEHKVGILRALHIAAETE